jgi:glycosyltransferase involved in cell wall biosynthesis
MSKKIKLLYYGDAPNVATGFASVSRNILTGLHATGKYDITVLGVNHHGDPHPYPFPIWPIGNGSQDPYGRQRAADMMMNPGLEFDVLFMLQDSFILQFMRDVMPKLKTVKKFTSVVYFPIDGIPKKEWVEAMSLFDECVTYTEFGKKESILAFPDIAGKLRVIPHGANSSDFYPLPQEEAVQFRRSYFGQLASKFIVTNVNRNQQRKDIPRTIASFKLFQEQRPNSVLYLHMAARDQGWNLPEVIKAYGLQLGRDVVLPGGDFGPNQGYPIEVVNKIYNTSDVIVSSTVGEGWGLSTTEAMATKTPIIFPRNTSLEEILGENEERGLLVDCGKNPSQFTVLPMDNEVVRPLMDVESMVEKLIYCHDKKEEVANKAEEAYNWVTSTLDWQKNIVPVWDKLITEAAEKDRSTASSRVISVEEL